eukprot:6380202-Lingulodinium_polyedra.AAC.1
MHHTKRGTGNLQIIARPHVAQHETALRAPRTKRPIVLVARRRDEDHEKSRRPLPSRPRAPSVLRRAG